MNAESKNSFLATTLSSIGDGVIATDLHGTIVYVNKAAEDITGWTELEIIGAKFYDIFILKDAETGRLLECPVNKALIACSAVGLEQNSALITKNGGSRFISANVAPIIGESGSYSGTVTVFRDISKVRKMELRLKQEQSNHIKVFDSAPAGIIIVNEDKLITRVNESALSFLCSDKHKSIGKRFGDAFLCRNSFIDEKSCTFSTECKACEIKKALNLALTSRISTTNIEFSRIFIINNEQKELWFKTSVTPMIIGSKRYAILVLMDITDRKNKEAEIARSRDFYLRIFENFPNMIWKTDVHGKTTYVDNNWVTFTGNAKEDSLEFKWLNFIHPDDRDRCYDAHNLHIKKREAFDFEYKLLHCSGEYRWIHTMNRPFYDIDGKFEGYIGTGVDITHLKIAEEGLSRYRILSENVRDIINFIDLEGNIIDVNEAAVRSYGYTREEFLKLNIRQLRAEGEVTRELLQKCYGDGIFYETVHYRKDGSIFPVEISAKGADIGGKRIIVSIIRDIAQRKAAESNLKANKEAAEIANKSKSEFLANMSHEIRTPINGIVGMVDLTLLTELNTEQRENLLIVKSCANSLLKIINDILDFSKMEAGKLLIENINFDIKSMIEETIKAHSPSAMAKGLELNYAFSSTIPHYVVGDPSRLKQILNNLISNAVKFTESGEVWVKVKKISSKGNEIEIQFSVEDSGIGIEEKDIGKLFESFSQLDGSITRKFGGTGLGLAISKQLSEIMGGRLWAESTKGVGSRFHFTLKVKIGSAIEKQRVEEYKGRSSISLYKLLIVEDDNVNLMVLSRFLRERGYLVETACNGLKAVEMCENNSYDLILMDIQMPVMDGIEAARRIREKDKYTPIIATTAYALKGDKEKFLNQGMDGYVSKPIKVEELFCEIDRCLLSRGDKVSISEVGICINSDGDIVLKQKETKVGEKRDAFMLEELSKEINLLNNSLGSGDIDQIESIAHKIKALSNELEIEELKTTAFKIELAARRGNLEQLIAKVLQVNHIFEVFKKSTI
jgi:PAS domain S-box-containing protein